MCPTESGERSVFHHGCVYVPQLAGCPFQTHVVEQHSAGERMPALVRPAMAHVAPAKVAGKSPVQAGVAPWLVALAITKHQPNCIGLDGHIVPLMNLNNGWW